jgi:hypothetical protein
MDEFPANSRRPPREPKEEKKVERAIQSEPIRRKKPLGKKAREIFIGGEAGSVWSYVFMDVMLPAAKDMIADAGSQFIERMIFGESRTNRRPSRTGGGSGTYTAYNRFAPQSRGPQREEPRNMSRRGRSTHDFDEIILATRVEAEEVVDRLFDLVGRYESASVSDLYSLVGISGNFTDEKWGWTDLRGAGVERVRNGYLLDLPRPEPLD